MIDFIIIWIPLISEDVLVTILQLILERLYNQVEKWNPAVNTVPVHTWIYPWISFLSKNAYLSLNKNSYRSAKLLYTIKVNYK